MADIEIVLKTKAELEGLRNYIAGMEQLIVHTKASGQPTAALERRLADLKDSLGKTTEATDNLSVKKKDLIANLRVLGHQIPGVTQAVALLKNPFVALGIVIAGVINYIRNLNATLRDNAGILEMERTTRAALPTLDQLRQKYADVATAVAALETASANYTDTLTAQFDLQKQIITLQAENLRLTIQQQLAAGKITPEQAAQQTALLEARSLGERQRLERVTLQGQLWSAQHRERQLTQLAAQGPTAAQMAVTEQRVQILRDLAGRAGFGAGGKMIPRPELRQQLAGYIAAPPLLAMPGQIQAAREQLAQLDRQDEGLRRAEVQLKDMQDKFQAAREARAALEKTRADRGRLETRYENLFQTQPLQTTGAAITIGTADILAERATAAAQAQAVQQVNARAETFMGGRAISDEIRGGLLDAFTVLTNEVRDLKRQIKNQLNQ